MMTHREAQIKKRGRMIGWVATFSYVLLWVVLVLLVKFDLNLQLGGEGILISFGDTEAANVGAPVAKQTAPKQVRQPEPKQEEQLTQDHEDAPVVVKKNDKKQTTKPKTEPKPVEPPKPQVNKRALFKGNVTQMATPGGGTKTGSGTQGAVNGSPEGLPDGDGKGGSGGRFDLAGRSLVGSLPKPSYNAKAEGRVVVDIRVSSEGKVISATYQSKGSTTQNAILVKAAENAAKQARFNVDNSSPVQQGTIVYIFKMQ
jgi:TonB family protein